MEATRNSSSEYQMITKTFKDSPLLERSRQQSFKFAANDVFDERPLDTGYNAVNDGGATVVNVTGEYHEVNVPRTEIYDSGVEISRFPIPTISGYSSLEAMEAHTPQNTNPVPVSLSHHQKSQSGYSSSEPQECRSPQNTNISPVSPSVHPKTLQLQGCRCCCHHTHHHHHHHTIVINGHQIEEASRTPVDRTLDGTVSRNSQRLGVLKTASCPAWADGFRNDGRPTDRGAQLKREDNLALCYASDITTSFPLGNRNCNNSGNRRSHGDVELSSDVDVRRTDYQYQKPVNSSGKKFCSKPTKGMIALITVLVIVIISLLLGLIYFLVRGNVSDSDSASSNTDVPSVSTVLNQTSICGKFPEKYFSFSPHTVNSKYPPSNLHPPENDNRINVSLAARIIGGVRANIVQYPWQISRSSVFNEPSMPENLADVSMVQGRIFGGTDTAATRFPWQVHLYAVSMWVKHRGMTCGGSLIMNDWVLTAAHCTESNGEPNLWTAYMGMSLIKEKSEPPAQSSKVIAIIQHGKYIHDFSYDYDVSLLKLKTPMTFTPTVQPICLPESTTEYRDGTKCYISGWGATTNSGQANAPPTLQHAQVDIIGYDTCRRDDWLGPLVSDRMMCAGKKDGSRDACQGDSGGPLSCYDDQKKTWTLAGSVSWGIECGQPKQPGVYAKISFFIDWIWNNIGRYEGWIEGVDGSGMGSGELMES